MAGNKNLYNANRAKQDEFYTQLVDIEKELRHYKKHFKDKVYPVMIPRNVRLSEAPSYGMPIIQYDVTSKGAECYSELAHLVSTGKAKKQSKSKGGRK